MVAGKIEQLVAIHIEQPAATTFFKYDRIGRIEDCESRHREDTCSPPKSIRKRSGSGYDRAVPLGIGKLLLEYSCRSSHKLYLCRTCHTGSSSASRNTTPSFVPAR